MSYTHCRFIIITLGICLVTASCAHVTTQPSAEQVPSLRQRIQTYWQAKIKGNLITTFQMETPSFQESTDPRLYLQTVGRSVNWKSFEIQDIQEKEDQAKVQILLHYVVIHGHGLVRLEKERTINERWVKEDGQWYHVYGSR